MFACMHIAVHEQSRLVPFMKNAKGSQLVWQIQRYDSMIQINKFNFFLKQNHIKRANFSYNKHKLHYSDIHLYSRFCFSTFNVW